MITGKLWKFSRQPFVGQAILRKIVGSHPLVAVAAANQHLSMIAQGLCAFSLLDVVQSRAQDGQGLGLVLQLRLLVLARDHHP